MFCPTPRLSSLNLLAFSKDMLDNARIGAVNPSLMDLDVETS